MYAQHVTAYTPHRAQVAAAAAAAELASDYVFVDEGVFAEPVDEAPPPGGSLEAQRAALATITEAQREAFIASETSANETSSKILAGLDDDQCTVSDDDVQARREARRAENVTAVADDDVN